MTLRATLKWLNDTFRPVRVEGADGYEPAIDKTTALTTMHVVNPMGGLGTEAAPPGYVPSQQEEAPR